MLQPTRGRHRDRGALRVAVRVRLLCGTAVYRQWTTTPTNAHTHAGDGCSGGKKVSSAQGRRRITRGRHSSRAKSIRASTPPPHSHPIPYNRSRHSAKLYPRANPTPLAAVSCRRRPMRSARLTDCRLDNTVENELPRNSRFHRAPLFPRYHFIFIHRVLCIMVTSYGRVARRRSIYNKTPLSIESVPVGRTPF